jgi:hypothetical protein
MAEFTEDRAKPPQHDEVYLRTVYACGVNRQHLIRVHRSKWPPRSMQGLNPAMVLEQPHVTAACERCGANVIAYDPPAPDLTIRLYGDASEAHGQVEDEARGVVLDEEAAPATGVVLDEPRGPRRK